MSDLLLVFCSYSHVTLNFIHSGFNCGEAVNFAMGQWFPLGNICRDRYAVLRKTPLIPHEELLCKEAVFLSEEMLQTSSRNDEGEYSSIKCKKAFVQFMRTQHYARWLLIKAGVRLLYKSDIQATVYCGICRRDCYVSHYMCSCNLDPICLHHGKCIKKSETCEIFARCHLSTEDEKYQNIAKQSSPKFSLGTWKK
jgi:hypothetical protein